MDENLPNVPQPEHDMQDTNLPAVMASLEMLTVTTSRTLPLENKRTLRKRIPKVMSSQILNRRCSQKPKKRVYTEGKNEEDVKDYYLDKNLKTVTHTLETIFEETDEAYENSSYMSIKRYKRMIQFQQHPSTTKIKKRRERIKKIFGTKFNFRTKKGSAMQGLLKDLNRIRLDTASNGDIEIK